MRQDNPDISDLPELSQPAHRALASIGVRQIKQLTKFSEAEIKQLYCIGPNMLTQLHHALCAKVLTFTLKK